MSFMESLTERKIAGFFAGVGALVFIGVGEHALAAVILATLVSFFVGEKNGLRRTQ